MLVANKSIQQISIMEMYVNKQYFVQLKMKSQARSSYLLMSCMTCLRTPILSLVFMRIVPLCNAICISFVRMLNMVEPRLLPVISIAYKENKVGHTQQFWNSQEEFVEIIIFKVPNRPLFFLIGFSYLVILFLFVGWCNIIH